ncbi:hypothetical protein M0804_010690 [Polistes exclamans]|nr:hypothetical protein M0804_010690 [Polistes exclamans]
MSRRVRVRVRVRGVWSKFEENRGKSTHAYDDDDDSCENDDGGVVVGDGAIVVVLVVLGALVRSRYGSEVRPWEPAYSFGLLYAPPGFLLCI